MAAAAGCGSAEAWGAPARSGSAPKGLDGAGGVPAGSAVSGGPAIARRGADAGVAVRGASGPGAGSVAGVAAADGEVDWAGVGGAAGVAGFRGCGAAGVCCWASAGCQALRLASRRWRASASGARLAASGSAVAIGAGPGGVTERPACGVAGAGRVSPACTMGRARVRTRAMSARTSAGTRARASGLERSARSCPRLSCDLASVVRVDRRVRAAVSVPVGLVASGRAACEASAIAASFRARSRCIEASPTSTGIAGNGLEMISMDLSGLTLTVSILAGPRLSRP